MSFTPHTPIKTRSTKENQPAVHRLLHSLSDDFNLQLQAHDPTLSSSRRQQQNRTDEQERVDLIHSRAQYLYFRDPSQLSRRIDQFRSQADELLRQWVHKPRGDPDTTPRSADPLRVRSSNKERAALQTLLLKLIQEVDLESRPRPRARRPKRPSDEFSEQEAKRAKGQNSSDCIDDIPVRTKAVVPAARPANAGTGGVSASEAFDNVEQSRSFSFRSRSAATSRLSFNQSVFSVATEGHYLSSQTTAPYDSSQKCSQDSYPACTAEYDALNESFSKYDTSSVYPEPELPEPKEEQPFVSQVEDVKASDTQVLESEGTAYSSVPEMADLEIPILDAPLINNRPSAALDDRLKNIWRKFSSSNNLHQSNGHSQVSHPWIKPRPIYHSLGTDPGCHPLQS